MQKVATRDMHDIRFAQDQIRGFAQAQRASMTDIEVETLAGRDPGAQEHPRAVGRLLRSGGKFPMVASAHMSVLTATVAGVPRIVRQRAAGERRTAPGDSWRPCTWAARTRSTFWAASRPWAPWPSAPGDDRAGAHDFVGPGNAFVAEAKRQLYGRVRHRPLRRADRDHGDRRRHGGCRTGRGPTCWARRNTAINSPACLITNSRKLAEATLAEIDRLLTILPPPTPPPSAGAHYGDVILCDTHDEMLSVANDMAYEHVQVMTDRDDWYLEKMHSYGALFLGPRTKCRQRRQGHRHQPHPAHPQGRALHRAGSGWASFSRPTATSASPPTAAATIDRRIRLQAVHARGVHRPRRTMQTSACAATVARTSPTGSPRNERSREASGQKPRLAGGRAGDGGRAGPRRHDMTPHFTPPSCGAAIAARGPSGGWRNFAATGSARCGPRSPTGST